MNTQKQKRIFNTASIIMIIIGIVHMVLYAVNIVMDKVFLQSLSADTLNMLPDSIKDVSAINAAVLSSIIGLVGSLIQIIAGILGIRIFKGKSKIKPEKCQMASIILIGLSFFSLIINLFFGGINIYLVGSFLLNCVVPLIYFISANSFKYTEFWNGIKNLEENENETDEETPAIRPDLVNARFIIDGRLQKSTLNSPSPDKKPYIDVLSRDMFKKGFGSSHSGRLLLKSLENVRYTKADRLSDCITGTLLVPVKPMIGDKFMEIGYLIDSEKIIFVDDSGVSANILEKLSDTELVGDSSTSSVFFEFIECLINGEIVFLQDYDTKLNTLEGNMLDDINEIPKDFEDFIMHTRRHLHIMGNYYKQLAALSDTIAVYGDQLLTSHTKDLYTYLTERISRLEEDCKSLREYALQMHDMYQSRIDVRQNKVMQFLTIVTTIFMPLTLITGWYGMNFERMPELHWYWGYMIIILIAIFIITLEIIIFKKKKWL